jgi:mono/diheme cytochrome c family protein
MKRSQTIVAIVILLAILAQAGLSVEKSKDGSEEKQESAWELAHASPAANARPNPYAGQERAALAGKKLYHRYCAACHGEDARGQGKAPDLHSPVVREAMPGALFWFLKNGSLKEGMPSWSRLPDQQLWQLVTFLGTLDRD